MTWRDRIKTATYTSPSKKKFEFKWDETEESVDHKSTVFRFPNSDGAEVQSLGLGESRFPITAFISGDNYDLEAKIFFDMLKEKGNGVLLHPLYGRKIVQATNLKRSDKVVEEGNQAIISILFIESKKIVVKDTIEDTVKKIEKEQAKFDVETPEEYANQKRFDTAQDTANSQARFDNNISTIDKILAPIAELNEEVNTFFKSVSLSLGNNLTDLIGKPLTLASQVITLIKTPARIVQSLSLRIKGYQDLATALRDRATITALTNDSRNNLLETRFLLSGCVSGMSETLLLQNYTTKAEALTAAVALQQFHAVNRDFIELEETKFQSSPLELLVYGDSQESKTLNEIVELTSNSLAQLSFDLKQERTIDLARDRNIVELTFELYGNIETDNINLLISANNLRGEEIIMIPKGREITYYA